MRSRHRRTGLKAGGSMPRGKEIFSWGDSFDGWGFGKILFLLKIIDK
jgi:hypothetical protein